ncbi:MAG: hypothetical protein IEMM0008_0760 [bacterium]|nr:MAG: hypothetical protein IEMM0008_0760 [bacterium]
MGNPNVKAELTPFDKVSVALYRSGIVVASLCLIFGVYYFYTLTIKGHTSFLLQSGVPEIIFWTFFVSVGLSLSFLHLYSSQILRFVQGFFVMSALILIPLTFMSENSFLSSIFAGNGEYNKFGTIGIGFLLAGYGAIGAKEAYCFKLYEGYLYAILSFFLVIIHLLGPSLKVELGLFTVITLLAVVFTIRKMGLPLHYDIGDKSHYQ